MSINPTIFREYDIRGIFKKELHETSVKTIGYALAEAIEGNKLVAVGYDARTHSPLLHDWLVSGLKAGGCTVVSMGMVATPVNYFANYRPLHDLCDDESVLERFGSDTLIDASVMITGSHNPPEYNGFKITVDRAPFFGDAIYALRDKIAKTAIPPITDAPVDATIDVKTPYIAFMIDQFSHLGQDSLPPIIVDCGNGAAGTVLPDILDGLHICYKALYCEPDGTFPNHHPDPSVEANLADVKDALQADEGKLGFAFDGDADRIAVLTPKHNIKGDQMALLFAMGMENPTVIGEVKCSQVMYDELKRRGATAVMYKTGHSNLKVKMKELNADLACEVSGHIFFKHRYFGYDDAIYAMLRMLELVHQGINLDDEIDALPQLYSTEEIKVETTDEEKFALIDRIKAMLQTPPNDFPIIRDIIDVDGVRIIFDSGWALVRASNTTPVLVTRFEADTKETAKIYEEKVNALIKMAKNGLNRLNGGIGVDR